MASNVKTARQDIVSRLTAALAGSASVFDSRTSPLEVSDLPAVVVSTPRSREESKGRGGEPAYLHTLSVQIECHVTGATDAAGAGARDDLEDSVLVALLADSAWAKLYSHMSDLTIQRGRDAESAWRHYASVIELELVWDEAYAPTIEDDLDGIDVDVDLISPTLPDGGPDDVIEAQTLWGDPAPVVP